MKYQTICRFAPSPTGFLHVGNIRVAIINFLYAKKTNGKFLLRLDDTDTKRVSDEYRDAIIQDMAWLGLKYDEIIKQSDRTKKYEEAHNRLIASGKLYECYETEEELNLQRKQQIASGLTPIYDRKALQLTKEQKENLRKSGVKPHYRFFLEDKIISWNDKIKGKISYQGKYCSDPVLIRDNGIPTYTFCSVVDDVEYGITDIIRGEDHITNTAVQIQIFEGLEATPPSFAHISLVKSVDGKISKREGGFDIKTLRNQGFEALSLINFLSQIGTSLGVKIYKSADELLQNFSLESFSKSSMNYDLNELENINRKLLQSLEFKDVKADLQKMKIDEKLLEKMWNSLKQNISFLKEIKEWVYIFQENFYYKNDEKDREFLALAKKLLPENTQDEKCFDVWIKKIKENSDKVGKELFMPIRLALTGKSYGAELKYIINCIKRDEIERRLCN
jgi:glutamyl-tRNA synthetase